MKFIKRLNAVFFVVIILSIICVGGVFWFANNDNDNFEQAKSTVGKRNVIDYKKAFSGKIILGTVNGVPITQNDVEKRPFSNDIVQTQINSEVVQEEDEAEEIKQNAKEQETDSLIFIGGELEKNSDGEIGTKLKESLQEIADLGFGPAIFTGNLIKFKKEEEKVSGRIMNIKELLSASFGEEFNISFGNGDVACGEICINGWGEIMFGEKIAPVKLSFAHAFEYKDAKVLLLEPGFFDDNEARKLEWLEAELKKNTQKNLIVVSHSSMSNFDNNFSDIVCVEECLEGKQNEVEKLFEKYNVDLVVFGDKEEFFYQKRGGVVYVSSGNFQEKMMEDNNEVIFSKIDFNENEMRLSAYNKMQEQIVDFKVK